MKRYYCCHCQERLVSEDGKWKRLSYSPYSDSFECKKNGTHEPR